MTHSSPLAVKIGGLELKNPVITASGTFGYGVEFADYFDLNRLGAMVVKGLSLAPAPGNPPPRIVETSCGMLNAIGLENIGIDAFVKDKLPELDFDETPVIANIYGKTIEEYTELSRRIDAIEGISAIEVNISCPNVKAGGVAFGIDPTAAGQVIESVRKQTRKTVIAKLSPNVTSVATIARSVEDHGADAVSLINTLTGMAVDVKTRRPRLGNITGGLSGPAIKPIALRMVWEVARVVKVPVIGIGGIMTAEDALEFMIVGATAVQIGTGTFVNPTAAIEIIDGLSEYVRDNHLNHIGELINTLQV